MAKTNWLVSGSRDKDGKIFVNKKDAVKEMDRQMRAGARESGLSEWKSPIPKSMKFNTKKKYWK